MEAEERDFRSGNCWKRRIFRASKNWRKMSRKLRLQEFSCYLRVANNPIIKYRNNIFYLYWNSNYSERIYSSIILYLLFIGSWPHRMKFSSTKDLLQVSLSIPQVYLKLFKHNITIVKAVVFHETSSFIHVILQLI